MSRDELNFDERLIEESAFDLELLTSSPRPNLRPKVSLKSSFDLRNEIKSQGAGTSANATGRRRWPNSPKGSRMNPRAANLDAFGGTFPL